MNVIFSKKDLCYALEATQKAAQTKVTSNTNNGFLLIAKDNQVEFQANDFSIGIKTVIPAHVQEGGIVNILASSLLSTIRQMPTDTITMEMKDHETTVYFHSGTYKANFQTRNSQDFPSVSVLDKSHHIKVKSFDFQNMARLTTFAAATDKQQPLFTGVLFDIENSVFTMVATNTHRMAAKELSLPTADDMQGRFIVPVDAINDCCKLLSVCGDETELEISWTARHVAFSINDTYYVGPLIDGEFPNYKRVIPQHFDSVATLDLKEFMEAVRFVSPIANDNNYQSINFAFKEGSLKIFEEDPTIGQSETFIPCQLDGEEMSITFKITYIEDILKHSTGEKIYLHLLKNGAMLVEQEEDKSFRYVVTPMRGRR